MKVRNDETLYHGKCFPEKDRANLNENLKAALCAYMPPMKAYPIKRNVELISEVPLMNEVADRVILKIVNLKPNGATFPM
ncbi:MULTISPECIES: hypothetical protein [unclassified Methanosarcina]|uniref:hypothetical protein n=1 Tax=unclassified Methanosarcina TaxID=2644672 RepID=UPI001F276B28|nr:MULTISPECIES: hypothetical protein [unclassified Methanosarcina]